MWSRPPHKVSPILALDLFMRRLCDGHSTHAAINDCVTFVMADATDSCHALEALSVRDLRHFSPPMKRSRPESPDAPPGLDLGLPAEPAPKKRRVHVLSVSVPAAKALRVRVLTCSGPVSKTLRVSFECV